MHPKSDVSESGDLFKFWEISDNVSLTVQRMTNRKSYVAYRLSSLAMPWNDLESHFRCLKPFNSRTS